MNDGPAPVPVERRAALRDWTATEDGRLTGMLARLPRPWTDDECFLYLRYVDRCLRRGVTYWTPAWCCVQVAAAGRKREPFGRRALDDISGCGDRRARKCLAAVGQWFDPAPATPVEESWIEAGNEVGPALLTPGSSRVRPGFVPGSDTKDEVEPMPLTPGSSRVRPGFVPIVRGISARVHPSPVTQPQGGSRAPTRTPDPPPGPRTHDGRALPADLAELLGDVGLTRTARALPLAGIDTPEKLLRMTADELAHTGGIAGAWRVIADACTAAGFPLGCLDPPVPMETGPPSRQRRVRTPAEEAAEIASYRLTPTPDPDP